MNSLITSCSSLVSKHHCILYPCTGICMFMDSFRRMIFFFFAMVTTVIIFYNVEKDNYSNVTARVMNTSVLFVVSNCIVERCLLRQGFNNIAISTDITAQIPSYYDIEIAFRKKAPIYWIQPVAAAVISGFKYLLVIH